LWQRIIRWRESFASFADAKLAKDGIADRLFVSASK